VRAVETVSGTLVLTGRYSRARIRRDGMTVTGRVWRTGARAYVESLEGSRSGKVIETSAFETG
jgi:hypothetical protein